MKSLPSPLILTIELRRRHFKGVNIGKMALLAFWLNVRKISGFLFFGLFEPGCCCISLHMKSKASTFIRIASTP